MLGKPTYEELEQRVLELEKADFKRKQTEASLWLKNVVFDVSFAANSIADIDGIIIEVNDAFLHIWGYPGKEDAVGKPIQHFLNDQDQAIAILTALNQTDKWEGEFIAKRRDGTTFISYGMATVLKDENGKMTGYQSTVINITGRKRMEDELRKNRELLDATQKLAKVGGWEWNVARQTMTWTNETYRIHGFEPGEFLSGSLEHIERGLLCYEPEDRPVIIGAFRRCAEEGQPYNLEFPFTTSDGSKLWIQTMAEAMLEDGKIARVIGHIIDITDRKRAEERYRSTIESSPEGMLFYRLDVDKLILIGTNPAADKILGIKMAPFIGNSIEDIFPQLIYTEIPERYRLVAATGQKWEADDIIYDHGGIKGIYSVIAFQTEPNHAVVMFTDITDRKKAEEESQHFTATLETRVKEYTQELQIANASLRKTTMRLRDLTEDVVQAEERERKRLATILHDDLQQLLVAAKMKAHRCVANLDHPQLRSDILELLEKSIGVSRNIVKDLSPPILWDGGLMMGLEWLCGSMRESYGLKVDIAGPEICEVSESLNILIFRAVRELLFNVVKHAGVDRAFIEVEQPNPCSLRIIVRDQGRGFSPNASEKFGLFGLRERITYIGGTIEVESTPQKGTRISFAVPLNSAASNGHLVVSNDAIKTASLSDTRIATYQVLVVDDHAVLRQGLMELLDKEEDITVISAASDGKQAIEKTRMLHPNIVLMDISMPGMSGIEATRIIMDEMPGTKVIGLSMYDQVEMRRAMNEAGAAAYLCKGGPIEDILSTIRSFPPVRKSNILKP